MSKQKIQWFRGSSYQHVVMLQVLHIIFNNNLRAGVTRAQDVYLACLEIIFIHAEYSDM